MGFWDSIKNGFDHFGSFVSNAVNTVATKAESAVSTVFNTAVGFGNKIVDGGFSFLSGQQKLIGDVINKGGDVITHGEDAIGSTVSNVASSLSLPLVIGAAIVGGILLIKK